MAKKSYALDAPAISKDWQAEEDHRTLMRAAEIAADRVRLKAALNCMKDTRRGMDKVMAMFSSRRYNGRI